MKPLGLVCLLLLLAMPLQAQSLRVPTTVFAAAATADWVSTLHARDCQEINPMINWVENPQAMVALGAAIDVAWVTAYHRVVGRKHPKMAAVGLYAVAGFRFWLAARNVRVQHEVERRPR